MYIEQIIANRLQYLVQGQVASTDRDADIKYYRSCDCKVWYNNDVAQIYVTGSNYCGEGIGTVAKPPVSMFP